MRTLRLSLAALLVVAFTAVPASAGTRVAPAAVCVGRHRAQLDPGLTATRGRSTLSTSGGTVICEGRIDGREVTGLQGEFHQGGVLVGTCAAGSMAGIMTMTFPTSGEPTTLTMAYQGTYGPVGGSLTTDRATATFTFVPSQGTCAGSPMTEVAVVHQTVVRP